MDCSASSVSIGEYRPGTRPIGEDLFQLKRVKIEDWDSNIALVLREPLYQLWNRIGWRNGSIHYSQNEDGSIEWEPYES